MKNFGLLILVFVLLSCKSNSFKHTLILDLNSIEKVNGAKKLFNNSIFDSDINSTGKYVLKDAIELYEDSLYLNSKFLKSKYTSSISKKTIEYPVVTKNRNNYSIDVMGYWLLGTNPPKEMDFPSHHFELVKIDEKTYDLVYFEHYFYKENVEIPIGRVLK